MPHARESRIGSECGPAGKDASRRKSPTRGDAARSDAPDALETRSEVSLFPIAPRLDGSILRSKRPSRRAGRRASCAERVRARLAPASSTNASASRREQRRRRLAIVRRKEAFKLFDSRRFVAPRRLFPPLDGEPDARQHADEENVPMVTRGFGLKKGRRRGKRGA